MMPPSRLGCPLNLETAHMGNPGSVVRGVGSSTVVPGSVGSYRPVIAGPKLRENATTILSRGRALQGVALSSIRFHPIGGGPKTTKTDKKHGSRQESHPLSD